MKLRAKVQCANKIGQCANKTVQSANKTAQSANKTDLFANNKFYNRSIDGELLFCC